MTNPLRISLAMLSLLAITLPTMSTSAAKEDTVYELRVYFAEPGKQSDILRLIETSGMKFAEKHQIKFEAAWVPVDPQDQRVITLVSHSDKASADKNWSGFQADTEWQQAQKKAIANGKIVNRLERFFLSTTDYSPMLTHETKGERVFELRSYLATDGNLDALNSRFRDHTLKLFEKHGITNVAYWTFLAGEKTTCGQLLEAVSPVGGAASASDSGSPAIDVALVYIITHASPDAAKQSFGSFGADPAWTKARTESEAKAGGSLTVKDGVKSLFLKATSFSPLQ